MYKKIKCPECEILINIETELKNKDITECPICEVILKIISKTPLIVKKINKHRKMIFK